MSTGKPHAHAPRPRDAGLEPSVGFEALRAELEAGESTKGYSLWVLGEICGILGDADSADDRHEQGDNAHDSELQPGPQRSAIIQKSEHVVGADLLGVLRVRRRFLLR